MRVESANLLIAKSGLDKVIEIYRAKNPAFYSAMAPVVSSNEAYYRALQESDFSIAPQVSPAGYIPVEEFDTPYFKDYYARKRALIAQNSTESIQSDLYGVVKKVGMKLDFAVEKSKEVEMAGFLNLATSTATADIGPDGVALASASHPYIGGVTSNIIGTNDALSIASLESASNSLVSQLSHKGDPLAYVGRKKLFVPPALKAAAQRLVGSDKYPGTNYNDPNVVGPDIEVVVNPWFTSTTAWALRMAADEEHGWRMISRRNNTTKVWQDNDTDSVKTSVTAIFCRAVMDWRGTMYSNGSGS